MLTDYELLTIRRLVEADCVPSDIPAALLKEVDALRAELKAVIGTGVRLAAEAAGETATLQEREACAKIADRVAEENEDPIISDCESVAKEIAYKIRNRYNVQASSQPPSGG